MIIIASCISAIVEVIATHPIDYIKTEKQKDRHFTFKNKKPFDFYTGITPRLLGVIPMRCLFWSSQSSINNYLKINNIEHKLNFLYIGTGCACTQTLIDSPIENIKMKLLAGEKVKPKHLLNCKGFAPNLYRNMVFASIFSYFSYSEKIRNTKETFLFSLIGGLSGSILSQPLDYVKTIKQQTYKSYYKTTLISDMSTINMIKYFIKVNPKQLFVGAFYRTLLSGCSMSIGFCVFNYFTPLNI